MKYTFKCADCGNKAIFEARTTRAVYDKARDAGWGISTKNNNEIKWCPKCAPFHRHVGRRGDVRPFVQVKLDV